MEKSELSEKLSKYRKEKQDIKYYLTEVKKIFDRKKLQGRFNKVNNLLDKKMKYQNLYIFF